MIHIGIKPPTKYVLVERLKMFGLFLFVYVRQGLIENNIVREIYKSSVATGLMDMVGNKGSLGVSMRVHETRLCFVCSHFASDTDKLEKRNSDYRATKSRLTFQFQDEQQQQSLNSLGFDLDDHDYVFWFGDLNYRLDNLTLTDTFKHIVDSEYERLVRFDQLSVERGKKRVFEEFQEGTINFKPTYKYLIKTDMYEKQSLVDSSSIDPTLVQGKQKLPSWTDRVLWRANNTALKCTQIDYSSINTITISDHKPVYSLFDVEVKKINRQKYDKLYETMLKDADRKYNGELPHVKVSPYELKFGVDLYFYDVRREQLTVTNSGQTRSNVSILFYEIPPSTPSPSSSSSSSCWLTIHPQTKERLGPGASYNVELSTCFSSNKSALRHLNRRKKIDDFLIVKCLNGNDVFVTVSCTYKPTLIGWSLKCLSQISEGTLDTSDMSMLSDVVEAEIDAHESDLDAIFRTRLADFQKLTNSKLETYKRTLTDLKHVIVESDPYFANELSAEYKFLMEHLIERCAVGNKSDTGESQTKDETKTIEELKNEALVALSSGEFTKLASLNLDLELLIELLYDLLYSLPHPLIPKRISDVCYTSSASCELDYDEAKWLLNFIPRSHMRLFELIAKFLGVYIRCFLGETKLLESGLSRLLAEAVFQLPNLTSSNFGGSQSTSKPAKSSDIDKTIGSNAMKFLNLFVSNYGF